MNLVQPSLFAELANYEGLLSQATEDALTCISLEIIVPHEEDLIDHLSPQELLSKFCTGEDYVQKMEPEDLPPNVTPVLYNLKIERMLNQCHHRANDFCLKRIFSTWGSLISFARTSYKNYMCVYHVINKNDHLKKDIRIARREVRKFKALNVSLESKALTIESKIIAEEKILKNNKKISF